MNMVLIQCKIFANGDNLICFVLKRVSSAYFFCSIMYIERLKYIPVRQGYTYKSFIEQRVKFETLLLCSFSDLQLIVC